MQHAGPSVEERLGALEATVRRLESRLESRGSGVAAPAAAGLLSLDVPGAPAPLGEHTGEAAGLGGSLAGAAALCVVLVFALVLRQATDGGWVPRDEGPALGLGYCAVLMALGAAWLDRRRALGGLLAVTAAALSPLIIVETYWRSQTLPLPAALGCAAALGLVSLGVGWWRRAPAVAVVGALGALLLGTFLDLAHAPLPALAAGLAATAALSEAMATRPGWGWLRWPTLGSVLFLALLWSSKLRGPSGGVDVPGGALLACVAMAGPFLLAAAAHGLRGREALHGFRALSPVVVLALPLALLGRVPDLSGSVAWTASLAGGALLAVGLRAARRGADAPRTEGAFLVAGSTLAVAWWPAAWGGVGTVAAVLLGPALSLAPLARFTRTPRVVAHLVMAAVLVRLAAAGAILQVPADAASAGLALLVCAAAVGQYALARSQPLPAVGWWADWDAPDHLAVAAAAAGVVGLFAAVRVLGHGSVPGGDAGFQFYQSLSACALAGAGMAVAHWRGLRDLVAACLLGVGLVAAKVVLYDTFTLPGPLAIPGVLAVAVLLAGSSVVMQKRAPARVGTAAPSGGGSEEKHG